MITHGVRMEAHLHGIFAHVVELNLDMRTVHYLQLEKRDKIGLIMAVSGLKKNQSL